MIPDKPNVASGRSIQLHGSDIFAVGNPIVRPSALPWITSHENVGYFLFMDFFYFCEEIESCDREVRSDTRDDLIFSIAREDTEYDRRIVGDREIHDTTSRLTTDIVEVWSISADHDTERDDEIICLRFEELRSITRYLECSWHPVRVYRFKSFSCEILTSHLLEWSSMMQIEFSYYDTDRDRAIE